MKMCLINNLKSLAYYVFRLALDNLEQMNVISIRCYA